MEKPKVATVWLEGCSGCHMSFLDLDEFLVFVLSAIDLTVSPLSDFKGFDFPNVDLGIIEGAIGTEEHLEIARKLRENTKTLMALGDCAVFGGINTLRNGVQKEEVMRRGFIETESTVDGIMPVHEDLPPLLDKVRPVNEVIPIDVYVPGCPPSPEAIACSLQDLLNGKIPELSTEMFHFD